MTAYNIATLWALPFLLFFGKKSDHAIIPDKFQVFNHAHSELDFVTLVDTTKSLAGEILTFIAEVYLSIQEKLALLFKEGTFLISWSAAGAVGHSDSLASYIVFKSKISAAYSAVHPTRSNEGRDMIGSCV